jgi:lantibiotic modifying enzyme
MFYFDVCRNFVESWTKFVGRSGYVQKKWYTFSCFVIILLTLIKNWTEFVTYRRKSTKKQRAYFALWTDLASRVSTYLLRDLET